MRVEDLLTRLKNVRKSGKGWTALCPSHDDHKNSFGVSIGDDGRILVNCYAQDGCDFNSIVSALELSPSDLMPERMEPIRNRETVYKLDTPHGLVEHVRIDKPGGKDFIFRLNGKNGLSGIKVRELPLYKPPGIQTKTDEIYITEGEKSAIAAAKIGCWAYGTVCGAKTSPESSQFEFCRGRDVILWSDNDEPGQIHMGKIAAKLRGIAASITTITTGDEKDDAADFKGTLEEVQAIVEKTRRGNRKSVLLADRMDGAIHSLARYCNNDNSDRIPTGISRMDYALRGGMMVGGLYLLGAPSGHGKTTLLQCMAVYCARTRGPVLFVSPEMSGQELAEREAIRTSGVSVNDIAPWLNPNIRLPSMVKLEDAAAKIKKERIPVHVTEDADMTMTEIGEEAKMMKDLKLIIVDYAQEIAARNASVARYLAVGEVGKEAIILGQKLNVPVIVASQVNVHDDGNNKGYSFRETKDLEHRAHCSMIMEVKRSTIPNAHGFFDVESARIFARKNRSGPIFSVDIEYSPAIYDIRNKKANYDY
jgi:replicative DNA helicase